MRLTFLATAILLVSMAGARFDPVSTPVLIILGCLALGLFVARDRSASSARMLPFDATNLSHPIGSGILTTFLLCMSIMSFLVYGPFILIHLFDFTPLAAGFVVMLESLAWGSAAILFSSTAAHSENRLIRTGSALVVAGLVAMALVLPRGPIWAIVLTVIITNGGVGMMWGFIIKRIIGAAPAAEKNRTASLVPIAQQTGFALGAALSGVIANGLGLSDDIASEDIRQIAFWLFAGFIPVAVLGNVTAWQFARGAGVGSANPETTELKRSAKCER